MSFLSVNITLRGLTSRLLPPSSPTSTRLIPAMSAAFFSTTPAMAAAAAPAKGGAPKATPKKKKGKGKGEARDPKIVNMLQHFAALSPRRIPAPLRMGRNRHLRHWTIHRAWLMFRRKQREQREGTLMRQYQSMHAACEELRQTEGPGTRDQGYLYRVAMEKKGVYGHNGVPIEYARPQTETPARMAWNHEWKP
ncbi:hypothetical protein QBC46DRAFT_394262 [Diplogelasinospora grovesii]|uniref:Large ribosomal subunit protein mL40 n=1 Tax=Diplogelasinospora grovesii TaxID=303347 RepID=A0AAN6N081_9PEZI|nr:hypothetical protein QBC46DRAFT_394262 [Diplogelasinospora grovesii]